MGDCRDSSSLTRGLLSRDRGYPKLPRLGCCYREPALDFPMGIARAGSLRWMARFSVPTHLHRGAILEVGFQFSCWALFFVVCYDSHSKVLAETAAIRRRSGFSHSVVPQQLLRGVRTNCHSRPAAVVSPRRPSTCRRPSFLRRFAWRQKRRRFRRAQSARACLGEWCCSFCFAYLRSPPNEASVKNAIAHAIFAGRH
jgi:hypothetical protein